LHVVSIINGPFFIVILPFPFHKEHLTIPDPCLHFVPFHEFQISVR